jgi:hypothetical protein
MVRLGIEIAHIVAVAMHDKTMRRQRVHRLFRGRIVGELDAEAGRGEIEAVLVEERLARHFQRHQQRSGQEKRDRRQDADGPGGPCEPRQRQ